jgi:FkbM family methyltransferase
MNNNLFHLLLFTICILVTSINIILWIKFRKLFSMVCDLKKTTFDSMDQLRLRIIQENHNLKQTTHSSSIKPLKFTSQFAEETIIFDILEGIQAGVFVEAGAYDGMNLSTTYALEQAGWRGLLVEPNEQNAKLSRERRLNSKVENCALGNMEATGFIEFTLAESDEGSPLSYVESDQKHIERCKQADCRISTHKVAFTNLSSLLEKNGFERVDFLSLDVEGMELDVLRGFQIQKYNPRLAMIELQFDSRDEAVIKYMKENGYAPIVKKECNLFFVPLKLERELTKKLFPYDNRVRL